MEAYYKQVLEGMRALPGVTAAGYARCQCSQATSGTPHVRGRPSGQDGEDMQAFMNSFRRDTGRPWACACWRAAISTSATPANKFTVAIVNRAFADALLRRPQSHRPAHRIRRRPQDQTEYRDRRDGGGFALRGPARRRAPPGLRAVRAGRFSRRWLRSMCGPSMDSTADVRARCGARWRSWTRPCRSTQMKTWATNWTRR